METIWNENDERLSRVYILLLADMFETFGNKSLKNYGLYPNHYLSAPDLRGDAMLRTKKNWTWAYFRSCHVYILWERYKRRNLLYLFSNRYRKVNNKYLESCNSKQKSGHIIYLDGNKLYGYAMSKCLSTIVFKCIDPKEFDFNKYTSNSSEQCVLEVLQNNCMNYKMIIF